MHALQRRFTVTHIFCEGEESEVDCSSFTNTLPILTSDGSITIYVRRAFQRAYPRSMVRQHMKNATAYVCIGRNPALCDIRSGHSSYD